MENKGAFKYSKNIVNLYPNGISNNRVTLFLKRYAICCIIVYVYATILHLFSLTQIFKSNFCLHCITLMNVTVQDTSSLAHLILSYHFLKPSSS